MKKTLALIFILLSLSGFSQHQQFTRIGVVNMESIASSYYAESSAYRRLVQERDDAQARIAAKNQNIAQLEQRKRELENEGKTNDALRVENQIMAEQNSLKDMIELRQQRLRRLRDEAMGDNAWLRNVLRAIQDVAQRHGYTVVLRMDDSNLLYYSDTVNITQLVLDALR